MLEIFSRGTVATCALMLACSQVALAHSGHDRTEEGRLDSMVKQAQLVFLGEVAGVD